MLGVINTAREGLRDQRLEVLHELGQWLLEVVEHVSDVRQAVVDNERLPRSHELDPQRVELALAVDSLPARGGSGGGGGLVDSA